VPLCESEARQQELDDKEARETDRENFRRLIYGLSLPTVKSKLKLKIKLWEFGQMELEK